VSWQSLSGRLETLPLVLAGPILRQVTPNAVTVWFALCKPAKVSLRVFKTGSPGSSLMATGTEPNSEPAATTPIGKNLHIVAATVRAETPLVPDQIYCYDATFVTTDNSPTTQTLAQAITKPGDQPPAKPLAYDPHDYPSFALPPADLKYLRLVHGSCRKPHGGSREKDEKDQTPAPDQLATLDGLIADPDSANNAMNRPHQLLLTGDQIYADDCDDQLLVSITDAADALLGWTGTGEILPSADPTTHAASTLAAGTRWQIITDAGFTGDDRRSHLISLGEFFAMYLFAWSDVLWSDPLTYAEFEEKANVTLTNHPTWTVPAAVESEYDGRQKAVQKFRETLPAVRRALANIPTYMILDDHEVTDDFNMTRDFVKQVYADDLGVRIVQNGLTAYAICQVWGNVPEQFDPGTPTAAGTQLLAQLAAVAGATDNPGAFEKASTGPTDPGGPATILQLVGVHRLSDMKDGDDGSIRAFHDGGATDIVTVNGIDVSTKSLRYNFTVEGPSHQVLVTDTRTWRGFAGTSEQLPILLYKQLEDQIVNAKPPLGGRLQLLVCTTNVPPIAAVRWLLHQSGMLWLWTAWRRHISHEQPNDAIEFTDVYDSWEFPGRAFDEMIVALTKRQTPVNGTIVAPVVLLSGDVHFSFSSRMAYWATARLGDDPTKPQAAKVTIAQLVSSSLKNEKDLTRQVQLGGYANPISATGWIKAAPYLATGALAAVGLGLGALGDEAFGGGQAKLKAGEIGAAAGALLGLVAINCIFGSQFPPPLPEAYIGWNIPTNAPDKLIAKPEAKTTYPFTVTGAAPTFNQNLNPTELTGALITPDYRYRLDYLKPVRPETTPVTAPPSPATGATAPQWGQSFAAAANARTDAISKGLKLPDCIGFNAIGEITFEWPATGKIVHHRLHWQSPGASGVASWVEYDVGVDDAALDADGKSYNDLTLDIAP
jgi:hypothetical protein